MSPSATKAEFGRLTLCNMTGARSLSQLHTLQYPGKGGVGAARHGGGCGQVDDGCMKQIESAPTHTPSKPHKEEPKRGNYILHVSAGVQIK